MDSVPQYITLLVRRDGEEFGIFSHGHKISKYQSVFPSDLYHHGLVHDSMDQAIAYMSKIWQNYTKAKDASDFAVEMIRQVQYSQSEEYCHVC